MDSSASCIFVSHAHTDHLPLSKKKPNFTPTAVCSEATARLFFERMGYEVQQNHSWSNDEFEIETLPGGHTFDSTVAEIRNLETGQNIIYTGDINIENRGYLKGFEPKKCDILILEATWGDRDYRFPSFENQIEKAKEFILQELEKGYPVALLGYPLGKSQLLNYCLGILSDTRFSSNSIWKMEQVHRKLGLNLFETEKLPQNLDEEAIANSNPWILFYNHVGYKDPTLGKLKTKYNLKVVGFSGWAKDLESYKYRMGADAAFTISDHSDYNSLLEIVKKSDPDKIFTVFGNAHELAKDLQKDGFNAVPLKEGQSTLDNFF
jgi:putative mRNA 3-end processing factor